MGVRRQQYAKELEKELAGGKKSLTKAHAAAAKKSMVKRVAKVQKRVAKTKRVPLETIKRKKSTWVSKLKKDIGRYYKSLKRSEREKKRRSK